MVFHRRLASHLPTCLSWHDLLYFYYYFSFENVEPFDHFAAFWFPFGPLYDISVLACFSVGSSILSVTKEDISRAHYTLNTV